MFLCCRMTWFTALIACMLLLGNLESARVSQITDRLGYGVVFKKYGTIALTTNMWRHTFQIILPSGQANTLSLVNCEEMNRPMDLCHMHNVYIQQFNNLTTNLNRKISSVLEEVKTLAGPILNVPKGNESLPTRTRSARSLLPIIGDLGSSLFGFATEGQLRNLANHVKEIIEVQAESSKNAHSNTEHLRTFMAKADARMDNLRSLIEANHDVVHDLSTRMLYYRDNLSELQLELTKMIPLLINQTNVHAYIERKLEGLVQGMHQLIQRQLPSVLVPAESILTAFEATETALKSVFPSWEIVYRQPNYIYGKRDLIYAYHDGSLYISIFIPVAPASETFDVYAIDAFDMPINQSVGHVTNIETELPTALALSTDGRYYTHMSAEDWAACDGQPIRTCDLLTGTRRTDAPSCALALFKDQGVLDICQFRVQEKTLKSFILEISPGKALISNTDEVIESCTNSQDSQKRPGCDFCTLDLKCGCGYTSPGYRIRPRLDECSNLVSTSRQFQVNRAVLESFFDAAKLAPIFNRTNLEEPIPVSIPPLQVTDRKFKLHADADKKLSVSLKHAVAAMKTGKKLYRQWPEIELDDMVSSSDAWVHGAIFYGGLTLTVVNTICLFELYRRQRALALILAYQIKIGNSLVAALESELVYSDQPEKAATTVNIKACHPTLQASVTGGLQLVTIGVIVFLAICAYRKIFKTRQGTQAVLWVCGGLQKTEIHLKDLPLFPCDYEDVITDGFANIELRSQGRFGSHKLMINWDEFVLTEKQTGRSVDLPNQVDLSFIQARRVKNALKTPINVYLLVSNGGLGIFVKPRRTNNDTVPENVNNCPSYPKIVM